MSEVRAVAPHRRTTSATYDAVSGTLRRIWTHPENRGRRGRRLVSWLTWQVWERAVRRPWTVTFHDGIQMICHPHDRVTSLALYSGLYDSEEMRFLLAWLRPGDTFVDVGSNVAPYSLLATRVPGTFAVAFEPGTLAIRRARANVELNGVGDRLALVQAAVSDVDGVGSLTADRWATNTLVEGAYTGRVEQVRTVRLDTYDAQDDLGPVSLMKVDVEGHELAVLRGADGVIAHHRPGLIVEVNDPVALRDWAGRSGYEAVTFEPATRTLNPRSWPAHRGGNIILVPDLVGARQRVRAAGGVALAD